MKRSAYVVLSLTILFIISASLRAFQDENATRHTTGGETKNPNTNRLHKPNGNGPENNNKRRHREEDQKNASTSGPVVGPVIKEPPGIPGIMVRVRTNVPGCEIYKVKADDSEERLGRSDEHGLFTYRLSSPSILLRAKMDGYSGDVTDIRPETINNAPNGEIKLNLEPLKASVTLTANVDGADVRIDNQPQSFPINKAIPVEPGTHNFTVSALGHKLVSLDHVALKPDETYKNSVTLQRLPNQELAQQAEKLYNNHAYKDASTLCNYMLESDPSYPPAHRLAGQIYLSHGDYANAGAHFAKALSGNDSVRLQIRRHAREAFDLNKGHDSCAGVLILSKNEVEFQGLQDASDDFRVAYGQLQVTGVELKKNRAIYLSTKVTDARGKYRVYDFYGFDNELSQSARPYLEMIHLLLQPH